MEAIKTTTVLDKCHRCGEVGYYHTYDGMDTTCPKCLGIASVESTQKALKVKKEKPTSLYVNMSKEMHSKVFEYAESKGITANGFVRMAINYYFEKEGN